MSTAQIGHAHETADASRTLRVLFVDDEPMLLRGLKRMLFKQRDRWDMVFALGGAEACDLLAGEHFDVVCTDMRMPGVDGPAVLERARELSPDTVRLVLSGYADAEMVTRVVGTAHQYLSKPCDADMLVEAIGRSVNLRAELRSDALRELVSRIGTLPSPPEAYREITARMQSRQTSFEDIGSAIRKDAAVTAKLLQLVNSSFFALRREISDPVQAVQLLGLDLVRGLVLGAGIMSACDEQDAGFASRQRDHAL